MFDRLFDRLLKWLEERKRDKLLKRWGGVQDCCWCRQCAQSGPGPWGYVAWDKNHFLDVLTCSVCGGTSLYRFELGMMFVAALDPPKPKYPNQSWFDERYKDSPSERGESHAM